MSKKIIPVARIIENAEPTQGIRIQFHVSAKVPKGYRLSRKLLVAAVRNWMDTGETGSKNVTVEAIEWTHAGGSTKRAEGGEAEEARANLWGVLQGIADEGINIQEVRTGENVP